VPRGKNWERASQKEFCKEGLSKKLPSIWVKNSAGEGMRSLRVIKGRTLRGGGNGGGAGMKKGGGTDALGGGSPQK